MKKVLAFLMVLVLSLSIVITALAAPNMTPNGKGCGHNKDKENTAHDKGCNGNGYGHVKFGCQCVEEPVDNEPVMD